MQITALPARRLSLMTSCAYHLAVGTYVVMDGQKSHVRVVYLGVVQQRIDDDEGIPRPPRQSES